MQAGERNRDEGYGPLGRPAIVDHLDVAAGFVIGKCYERHRATEFLNFLKQIDGRLPEALDV